MHRNVKKTLPNRQLIAATGIIIPVKWDAFGNPLRVALSTNKEKIYVIDNRSSKGKEVARLLHKQVKIEGTLNKKETIAVKRYTCINSEKHYNLANNLVFSLKANEG